MRQTIRAIQQEDIPYLKEVLIPGLPDCEWTLEYNLYLTDPTNTQVAASVDLKLRFLMSTMFKMAEYHLS